MNGDGVGDWAAGAPDNDKSLDGAGRVAVLNGSNGRKVAALFGAEEDAHFGASVAAVPEVDGDGIKELLVGAPGAGASGEGSMTLFAGGSWVELLEVTGLAPDAGLGGDLDSVFDANGDGIADPIGTSRASGRARVDLFSGATGTTLARVRESDSASISVSGVPAWIAESSSSPLSAVVATHEGHVGGITCVEIADLYLDFLPSSAPPDTDVTIDVRGGPAHSFAGLLLAEVDGVPFDTFVAFGCLDPLGQWTFVERVPWGLEGLEFTLRAYAVGFDGKLASSVDEDFTVE